MKRRTACNAMLLVMAALSSRMPRAQVVGRPARLAFLVEPALEAPLQQAIVKALLEGLRALGYVEGRNFSIEFRSADGNFSRLPTMAEELLRQRPDVLVTAWPASAMAAKEATRTVPVVAVSVDNPVAMGLAQSFSRPGGNITGIGSWALEIVAKRLQVLREFVPTARRVGILFNPDAVGPGGLEPALTNWQKGLGLAIHPYPARGPTDFDGAFAAMVRDGIGGLLVFADSNTYTHRVLLNQMCLQRRMPSVWGGRDFMTGGALASYQSDFPDMFRRSAALIGKILKGAKPGEVPFEQSSKLELVIDAKAARALGVVVPPALLLSADHVIE
ncbi:ABC transporter substrate-binding protein [Variovorax rhizosphaerae]|uniref:ABC transporter substrate-binding protein n=1 Tax=Variovorax rhizosphaerae TaxID=1836200 RepID=A0ABU8WWM2_9BURK